MSEEIDARIYGIARAGQGEQYGVYGDTDAADGYGLYTPQNAVVDGTLDAGALSSPALAPDAVVYESDDGTAYAVDSDGVLASDPETAAVVQVALDAYPGGYVAQTSDITVESTLTLVNQRYDGFGHVIHSRVPDGDWTIVQQLDRPESTDGDDTANGAEVNAKILRAFSGIRNLHIDCKDRDTTGIDHQRKGIYTEDGIHATYENVAIYAPKVGWDITDDEAWTEASVWNNILIRNTFDAGMRIGSVSFSCQFENIRISESGAGAVLLDLTDDGMESGREGHTIEHTQFENLILWPAVNDSDNANVTALRLDAEFSDVTFRGLQQHPGPDSTTLHVTSGASGSVTFEDSIFTDYVTVADSADLSMTFDTQPILHPDHAVTEDFGDGELTSDRHSVKYYDEASGDVVHLRPSWSRTFSNVETESGNIVVSDGSAPGLRIGAAAIDTDHRWSLTFRYRQVPDDGPLHFHLFRDPADNHNIIALVDPNGDVLLKDFRTNTEITERHEWGHDTNEHTMTVERSAAGDWELWWDGVSVGTGSYTPLPDAAIFGIDSFTRTADGQPVPVEITDVTYQL